MKGRWELQESHLRKEKATKSVFFYANASWPAVSVRARGGLGPTGAFYASAPLADRMIFPASPASKKFKKKG